MTRIIGVLPDQRQAGGLVDSLKIAGFDRKDMIVSDVNKNFAPGTNPDEAPYIQLERDGLWEGTAFTNFLRGEIDQGIVVAVEAPKHEAGRIREIMEQNGAIKIMQD